MNANEIRFYLHNYDANKKEIEKLKDELKEYRLMDGVKAQVITDMPMTHSNESKQETVLFTTYRYKGDELNLMEYVHMLEMELHHKMRVNRAIDSVYLYLKEPARSIIEMRYFITPTVNDIRKRKYNWEEIANEVNYSEQSCRRIDQKVVTQILNKLIQKMSVLGA